MMPLDDALELCLVLLELQPERFDGAAARWAARLVLERRLAVGDAQLALSSIAALGAGGAVRRTEALTCLCERYGLDRGERGDATGPNWGMPDRGEATLALCGALAPVAKYVREQAECHDAAPAHHQAWKVPAATFLISLSSPDPPARRSTPPAGT